MNLISINDLSEGQIREIFDQARAFNGWEPPSGTSALLLFGEPSTRTRVSFQLAAQELRMNCLYLDPTSLSLSKGESLLDTFETFANYDPGYVVIRHKNGTACQMAESIFDKRATIISAGTGTTNHPTQALGDGFIINNLVSKGWREPKIAIVGDIVHSRVARSLIQLADKLEWEVKLYGPPEFLPAHGMEDEHEQFTELVDLDWADFVYVIRPQLERLEPDMFNRDNYIYNWRISSEHLTENQLLMHAGPVNRGLELASDTFNRPSTLIQSQVRIGHEMRKFLFGWLKHGNNRPASSSDLGFLDRLSSSPYNSHPGL